ncbi:Cu-Zn family superoxide dismutase [Nocardiopsis mwathae]|uniref:Cu-Zn family superoxide dismutase n=2 Tax=Nocardiopsis mwathae TaxID=1472723 RepID=A0A7W9YMK5_9ACTN|nr:superoxide dismutase family protein [Nocardiopsis mwathae]MBB6173966.1 Cu-Zn family superoxide dismutase [Nocardiopsis mwathae]
MTRTLVGAALFSLLLTGCGPTAPNDDDTTDNGDDAVETPADGGQEAMEPIQVSGSWEPYAADATAVTYDEAVPEGGTVDVDIRSEGPEGTRVTLKATGLEPDRDYGAHVHTRPCGEEPGDSGPHYQDEVDPAATDEEPSTDPAFANPDNEFWLDFTTDDEGAGEATATVDFRVRPGEANSVVIHEEHTKTEHGEAGTAGDRLGCVNVPM